MMPYLAVLPKLFNSDVSGKGQDQTIKALFVTVGNAIFLAITLAGILAVGMVIVGGIMYITSAGDPARAAQAKGTIQNALLGLALCVIADGLVIWITNQFGR